MYPYIVWTIMIAVCIKYNCKTLEIVFIAKYRTSLHSLFGIPNGKSIPIQFSPFAMDFEVYLKLPISYMAGL